MYTYLCVRVWMHICLSMYVCVYVCVYLFFTANGAAYFEIMLAWNFMCMQVCICAFRSQHTFLCSFMVIYLDGLIYNLFLFLQETKGRKNNNMGKELSTGFL